MDLLYFLFCLVFAMSLCASVHMCFVVTCWERAYLLALVCVVCCVFVTFLGQVWYLIVSVPDLFTLTSLLTLVKVHFVMLNTKYHSSRFCGFKEEDF